MAGNGWGYSAPGAPSIRIQCVSYAIPTAFVSAGVDLAPEEGPFNYQVAYGSSTSKMLCFISILAMTAEWMCSYIYS